MLQPPSNKKRVPTIGDPQGGIARPVASRRELRVVVMGVVVLIGIAMWWIRGLPGARGHEAIEPPSGAGVPAMLRPDLAAFPPLPEAAEIAAARADVERMLRAGEVPPLSLGLDGISLAWGERLLAEDSEHRRIPQRITVEDVLGDQVRSGQLVVISGRLDDLGNTAVAGREDAGYRWLTVALPQGQYLTALQPILDDQAALTINGQVQVLGRYLGRLPRPAVGGAGEVITPMMMARVVTPLAEDAGEHVGGIAGYQGQVIIPPNVYQDVDDERPLIESHPYYLTLGEVKSEMGTPEIVGERLDANREANAIHQNPSAYRGRPVDVRGVVWHAWEDEMVSADRPFDVRRVVRVLMYRRDIGPITENGKTVNKSVLRIFELAAITDQPLPKPGDFLVAQGRFMKWRSIPVDRHPGMERLMNNGRQSNRVYTMFIVSGPWRTEEPVTIDWTPVVVLLSVGVVAFAILVLWYIHRDRGAERRMKETVATLRQRRRALVHGQAPVDAEAKPAPESAAPEPAIPDSTPLESAQETPPPLEPPPDR